MFVGWIGLLVLSTPAVWSRDAGKAPHAAAPVGIVSEPCPPPATLTPAARELLVDVFIEPRRLTPADFERLGKNADLNRYNEANRRLALQDWPGLCRFRAANAGVLKAAQPPRVVFMGDSITENWALADPQLFERGIVNRGISGQTTPQMLLRFRADVLALKPQVVHILAGTNDVAGNTGPTTAQDFENNIESMVTLARQQGIRVVLGSIPPAKAFFWRPGIDPVPQINALDAWLRAYAAQNGVAYVDYYAALAGSNGELKADLSNDGVHPNREGYRLMRALAEAAIASSNTRSVQHWVATWATAQQLAPNPPRRAIKPPANMPPQPPSPIVPTPEKIGNQTVRMIARASIGGAQVRVQLSNVQGMQPLLVGAAHIALHARDSSIVPGSDRVLTFGGQRKFSVPPGALLLSDPVDLDVPPLADLAVSLYIPEQTASLAIHPLGLRTTYITDGDATAQESLPGAATNRSYFWLTGIEVRAAASTAAIAAFGDSITDGFATTPETNRAWPSLLAERLLGKTPAEGRWSVLNLGISGNRVLRDGAGTNALARFDRDVLGRPGVRWMILLEGINDISFGYIPGMPATERIRSEELIAGLQVLVERAHAHGIKVMGATLLPWEGVWTYDKDAEAIRQAVNEWIRTGGAFDAVVDFDAVTRDPAQPTRLRPQLDSGDHVHPNDAGNRAMAEAIDIAQLE
jgi:lysophospholipase L1-like esterase